ncbi:MAG: RNA-binding protein [Bacteroidales bacterium]|nr:RNA-binding protein [Bacteroidales bacterium]
MKIFVAKLGFDTRSEDLFALFSKFGKVDSAKVIMDRDTNRSKCYGFVEMPNENEAYVAVVELNECIFQKSVINVKKSKQKQVEYHV